MAAGALPGIEVWVETIDPTHYALFACRRWEEAPRLTIWAIFEKPDRYPAADCLRRGARGYMVAELLAHESRAHPRWIKTVQRRVAEKFANGWALEQIYEVEQWNTLRPLVRIEPAPEQESP